MAKLNTHVHAVERNPDGSQGRTGHFGPGDEVPDWAQKAITNPDVWEEAPAPTEATSASTPQGVEVKEPPRGGPGSSVEAWREFAKAKGLDFPDGASARDIQAAWDARS